MVTKDFFFFKKCKKIVWLILIITMKKGGRIAYFYLFCSYTFICSFDEHYETIIRIIDNFRIRNQQLLRENIACLELNVL